MGHVQFPICIEAVAPAKCAGIPHVGPYHQIGPAFQALFAQLSQAGLMGQHGVTMGIYKDNPEVVPAEQCRSMAVVEVSDETVQWPDGFEVCEVTGGTAAIMTVTGSYNQLPDAWMQFAPRVFGEMGRTPAVGFSREVYTHVDFENDANNVTKLVLFVERLAAEP